MFVFFIDRQAGNGKVVFLIGESSHVFPLRTLSAESPDSPTMNNDWRFNVVHFIDFDVSRPDMRDGVGVSASVSWTARATSWTMVITRIALRSLCGVFAK